MKIQIDTIPHKTQRYDTCGDWWWEGDTLQIRVSEMGDWRKEMSVAYHELFECLVCKQRGITQKQADDFDTSWEEHDGYEEPGDDPKSPYHREHQLAMAPEHILADALDLNWAEYAESVMSLEYEDE